MYRPLKPKGKKTPPRMLEGHSVFDISKGFGQVMGIASQLDLLQAQYQTKITALGSLTSKTEGKVNEELIKLNAKFTRDALLLLKESSGIILKDIKDRWVADLNKLLSAVDKAETAIDHAKSIQKGDKGDKGDDGVSPDLDELVERVFRMVRVPKDGKDCNELEVVKKVVKVIYKMGLDIKDIKGLEERLRHLGSKMMFGGGGGGGQGSWKVKTLSGLLNGINTQFTYEGDMPADNSHRVILNYQEQDPLVDYTISGSGGTITVTYTTAPPSAFSGSRHIIRYQ